TLSTAASPRLFFLQADDGIRDFHVTGVQTCALPICDLRPYCPYDSCVPYDPYAACVPCSPCYSFRARCGPSPCPCPHAQGQARRSEERRVGKEYGTERERRSCQSSISMEDEGGGRTE